MSINRLVGIHVFGWAVRESEDEPTTWGTRRITRLDCQYHGTPIDSGPHFDREIAAAWEVVEHLRKQRSATDKVDDPTWSVALNGSGDRWICDVSDWRGRLDVAACDKTVCMAICWAALRAFNVDEATIQEACK